MQNRVDGRRTAAEDRADGRSALPSQRRERGLSDRLWERVKPLLPPPAPKPRGGRPRADDRAWFEGIVHVLRSGRRWEGVPPGRFPPGPTCRRRRHAEWAGGGVWEAARRAVLDELAEAGALDPSELYLDGTFVPAQEGATRSPSPVSARA